MVSRIAEVAVNVPLSKSFHYAIPEALAGKVRRGHRVLIPFGMRTTTGVCTSFPEKSDVPQLKPIVDVLHPDCRFDDHLLELTRWIANYYRASWGEVLEAALPPSIRAGKREQRVRLLTAARTPEELEAEAERIQKRAPVRALLLRHLAAHPGPHLRGDLLEAVPTKPEVLRRVVKDGWVREDEVVSRPDPFKDDAQLLPRTDPELHPDQLAALNMVRDARSQGGFQPILLHGVTGSGKTEVYIRALREVLAQGGRGLVLVPEISLTPQTVVRFREGLPGTTVAVLHSMLSPAERTGQWRDIQEGHAKVVIGARSAAFAPIPDLQLIIVDEEHESSYKQESSPRYHGRDVAVVRARLLGIPVILGSATPSLESAHNSRSGKYRLAELPERATTHDLPDVSIVPLEPTFYRSDGKGLVSQQLDYLIRRRLKENDQILIFLNRRGFATYLSCVRCGFVLKCEQCDVTLTFHRRENLARCHYCGLARPLPENCPDCQMPGPRKRGAGTEKAVEALEQLYPDARIARLDRDAVSTHRKLKETLLRFSRGDYNILVGTQMIAKGHDFPRVSLVGILLADTGLHFPDFRAVERTFQLITQVAGRAGRGDRPGRVVVQTFFPDHYAIRYAASGDYRGLLEKELESRKTFGYPPFGRLVKIVISGTVEDKVKKEADRIGKILKQHAPDGCQVLGPVVSPIAKIQSRYRMQVLLKSRSSASLHDLLEKNERELKSRGKTDVAIDVDPQSML